MRTHFFLPLLLVISLIFQLGCGGGGGGSSFGTLSYVTDWTLRNNPNGGLSQRISLYDLNGRIAKTLTAEQSVSGLQTYTITGISSGTYRLFVELYRGAGLSGSLVGVISDFVDIGGTATYRTAVGEGVTATRVSPPMASIAVPESVQFYGIGIGSSGYPTFTVDGGFTWQALGGVASVSNKGLATATTAGSGSVRATHIASGFSGAGSLTVSPFVPKTAKWTVLVYMNAANDLYTYSVLNMNQMERVADNPDVRFVVQWKQSTDVFPNSTFDGTRRYLVQPESTSAIGSKLIQDLGTSVDMGQPQTLSDFIRWGKTYYPATRYALIIWNHGAGWRRSPEDELPTRGFSYDDDTGNAIQTWELAQALGSRTLDILSWDASLMQMLEVAGEIPNTVRYMVGSEESPPGEGLPYDTVFAEFRDRPNDTTAALSKAFVDGMVGAPQYASRKITQSVIDVSKVGALLNALDVLGTELQHNRTALTAIVQAVRSQSQAYSQTTLRYYRDLIDVCTRLRAATSIVAVQTACTNVIAAATDALVWEGHNANSAGSRGISIDFSPGPVFLGGAADYGRLKIGQTTSWDEWLSVAP